MPTKITNIEDEIIEKSLTQNPKQIADSMGKHVRDVLEILSTPAAKEIRETKLAVANADLQYKRIKRAEALVDELIDGIEKLLKLNPVGWKMSHVKLFELLMKEIPEQVKSLKQININPTTNYNQLTEEKKLEQSLEQKMEQLPADAKIKFWKEVEEKAEEFISKYGIQSL